MEKEEEEEKEKGEEGKEEERGRKIQQTPVGSRRRWDMSGSPHHVFPWLAMTKEREPNHCPDESRAVHALTTNS